MREAHAIQLLLAALLRSADRPHPLVADLLGVNVLDQFMKDGGTYRFRRHGVYSATPASGVQLEPPQPHYQSVTYNTLNGGIARHFAPIEPSIASGKVLMSALELCRATFSGLAPFNH